MLFLSSIKSVTSTLEIRGIMYGRINKIVYCLDTLQVKGLINPQKKLISVNKCKDEIIEKCKIFGIKVIDKYEKLSLNIIDNNINMVEYKYIKKLEAVCKSFIGKEITIDACINGRNIPITNINIIGNTLEDIFYPFFKEACPDFEEGPKQSSPDYYADNRNFQFELKAFYKTPGFDISNFTSFIYQVSEDLIKKIFKTKYLVFEYDIKNNTFVIKNFWLLNIWELPTYDKTNPISIQSKKNMWYNIRPGPKTSWTKGYKTSFMFIEKLIECIKKCPNEIDEKDKLIQAIFKQLEEAKIQGFL